MTLAVGRGRISRTWSKPRPPTPMMPMLSCFFSAPRQPMVGRVVAEAEARVPLARARPVAVEEARKRRREREWLDTAISGETDNPYYRGGKGGVEGRECGGSPPGAGGATFLSDVV